MAHERISKENKNSLFNNVIVVYLSGVSQFYFKTALPKLYSFIEIYDEKIKCQWNRLFLVNIILLIMILLSMIC